MKKILINLILILVFIEPSILFSEVDFYAMPYDKSLDSLINKASSQIVKKYGMDLIGIKEETLGSVKLIGFRFQISKPTSKNEARKLIVNSVQDFLTVINQDERIRPYLEVFPFGSNDVEIFIFFNTIDQRTLYHPDLTVVSAYCGKIIYSTNDPKNKCLYESEETETFEDAVKILKGEIPVPASNIK